MNTPSILVSTANIVAFVADPLMGVLGFMMFRRPQAWAKMNARLARKEVHEFDSPKTTGVYQAAWNLIHGHRFVLIVEYARVESQACSPELTGKACPLPLDSNAPCIELRLTPQRFLATVPTATSTAPVKQAKNHC